MDYDYDMVLATVQSKIEPISVRELQALLLSKEKRLENNESMINNSLLPSINIANKIDNFKGISDFQSHPFSQFQNNSFDKSKP